MKHRRNSTHTDAFSRCELVILLATIALLFALVLPTLAASRARNLAVECVNHLRRVGQGFQVWAIDHGDLFPWNTSSQEGGSQGQMAAYSHFLAVSNEFGTPRFLTCPSDLRVRATSFGSGSFRNQNLSYFAGLHGNLTQPRSWLAGDRNITGQDGVSCSVAQVSATRIWATNVSAWDATIHIRSGNLVLGDGSTAQVANRELTNSVGRAVMQDLQSVVDILKPFP
jgi:competence protein ComGC